MYHQSQSPVVILSEATNLWLFLSQCFHGAPANSQRCFAWLNMTDERQNGAKCSSAALYREVDHRRIGNNDV